MIAHCSIGGWVSSSCISSNPSHEHTLGERHESAAASTPPLVEVVPVKPAPADSGLTLPGETAAWYESTIYARVDGYVGKWSADIGDDVKKGQVLATIETPELDAQLAATKAKLVAAQADAELAKTTYARWKDSPKGVVSEQEREEKKADYTSAYGASGARSGRCGTL